MSYVKKIRLELGKDRFFEYDQDKDITAFVNGRVRKNYPVKKLTIKDSIFLGDKRLRITKVQPKEVKVDRK